MTDKQEDYFSMLIVLNALLINFITTVESIPAFKRALDLFTPLLEKIKQVDSGRGSITSGKTDIKGSVRSDLINAVTLAASALFTYAGEHNKPEILNRVDRPDSYYSRMRDSNLIMEATALLNLTKGIETDLVEHGLNADEITSLTTLADTYKKAIEEAGTSSVDGTSATANVYQLIGEAKFIVENKFDKHIKIFRKKNPEFYEKYWSARKVVETGIRHNKKDAPPANEAPKEAGT